MENLARKYAVSSSNSIRRKVRTEGWQRDLEAIAAFVTTRTIGGGKAPENAHDEINPTKAVLRKKVAAHIAVTNSRPEAIDVGAPSLARTITEAGEDAGPTPIERAAIRNEEQEVTTARGVAKRNSDVILQQLEAGAQVEQVGLNVLGVIAAYLAAPPNSDALTNTARRLIGVNPDRETLAGLLTAATNLVKSGTAMKRQALAMDVVIAPGAPAPVEIVKGAGARLLGNLSPEAMMKMRAAAQEAARLPPGRLAPIEPA